MGIDAYLTGPLLQLRLAELKRAKGVTKSLTLSEHKMRRMWEDGDEDDRAAVRQAIIEHVTTCPDEQFHYILEAYEGQTRAKLEQINNEIYAIEEELKSGG